MAPGWRSLQEPGSSHWPGYLILGPHTHGHSRGYRAWPRPCQQGTWVQTQGERQGVLRGKESGKRRGFCGLHDSSPHPLAGFGKELSMALLPLGLLLSVQSGNLRNWPFSIRPTLSSLGCSGSPSEGASHCKSRVRSPLGTG